MWGLDVLLIRTHATNVVRSHLPNVPLLPILHLSLSNHELSASRNMIDTTKLIRRVCSFRMGGVVNLTEGKVNAILSLICQGAEVSMLAFLRPFNDFQSELVGEFSSWCNLSAYVAIVFPVLSGWEPQWLGDITKIILAVLATCVAGTNALLAPLKGVLTYILNILKKIRCRCFASRKLLNSSTARRRSSVVVTALSSAATATVGIVAGFVQVCCAL